MKRLQTVYECIKCFTRYKNKQFTCGDCGNRTVKKIKVNIESTKPTYSNQEKYITEKLEDIVNAFRQLEQTHPSHENDFIDGIHKCQYVIMHKILQRNYPKEYPTYKANK